MLELRKFNLQLALVRTGPLRKNIKNQPGAIENPTFAQTFEIAFLTGTELMIDEHEISTGFRHHLPDLVGLARPDQIFRARTRAGCRNGSH